MVDYLIFGAVMAPFITLVIGLIIDLFTEEYE
jgi:hypothetical protein